MCFPQPRVLKELQNAMTNLFKPQQFHIKEPRKIDYAK